MPRKRVPLSHKGEYPFEVCLYKAACPTCGNQIEWRAEFDADGTDYLAYCCGKYIRMSPHTVTVTIGKGDSP